MSKKTWTPVTSKKSRYQGDVFIKRDDKFVLKVYAGSVPNTMKFAVHVCGYLNALEAALDAKPVPRQGRPGVDDHVPF